MSASSYLNEIIGFGGENVSRGEAMKIMQDEGHPQRCIDAYMMGARTYKEEIRRQFNHIAQRQASVSRPDLPGPDYSAS